MHVCVCGWLADYVPTCVVCVCVDGWMSVGGWVAECMSTCVACVCLCVCTCVCVFACVCACCLHPSQVSVCCLF